jgi:hypothetical protein
MDQNVLVKAGRLIIKELTRRGVDVRAAMWVYKADLDAWKLLIVPRKSYSDAREFYRLLSSIVSENRPQLGQVDTSDVEMAKDTHPAIKAINRIAKVTGDSLFVAEKSIFGGVYLEKLIVLHMDV